MTRRVGLIGASVALAYVAAVLATSVFTTHHVRPLFDAGAPPPAYRWVKPPPDFAPGNIVPKSTDLVLGLKPEDIPPSGSSEDAQFVFSLPRGAIAPSATATSVNAHIQPFDPDKLGPLPAKEFADGNAYQLTFNYVGGGPAVVTTPGSLLLTVAVPADAVDYSTDGKTWRALKSQHASATSIGADLPGAGYYVAVSPDFLGSTKSGGAGRLIVPIVITALVAAALVFGVPALRRRRR